MSKVLIVETNVTRYQGTDEPTGLWLGESAEFVDEMQKAGVAVDYVSPKGGFVPLDPRSMKYTDTDIMRIYEEPDFVQHALVQTLRPDQVNAADYDAIYYTGGHGVMWDFPDDAALQAISREIYAAGGYVTSVCHGIAGLLNIKDDAGNYLIAGKTITGFTTAEEIIAGKMKVVPFLNRKVALARGAKFSKKRFYSEYAVQDGQLITGQNPFSVRAVARKLIAAL
ncbi:type 1 glutamine amidotransferase domain-containing protein [Lacticaseibacillus songhuajiangensis]|jgi:putative intracellular protease/amidase|uniref:type 1 glutamine amidotransferase domain-containing protein n=1 Tax=Lacticaseibacillus songhuajiangensis TaxID=1296539 RepID=UPI000F7B9492|nr:type 1 glutamine amidotransferase domain-containing protein [Lacticaseibacillus songhuajiangensis]